MHPIIALTQKLLAITFDYSGGKDTAGLEGTPKRIERNHLFL